MSWIRRAVPLALLALSLPLGCTDDTEDDTANDSGSNNDTSASATNPTADATADETASADDSAVLGCAADITFDTTNGATEAVMETWGAACTTDADCVALIGEGAVCDTVAVLYELPGGYCTKPCTLPDENTRTVLDAVDCDPAGGVACIGVQGTFERCAIVCTDDMQCNRDGYECRQMPLISAEGDPSLCLMPDCCQGSCTET